MIMPIEQVVLALARGAQIFQKSRSCVKILDIRSMTWSKFYTEDA